MIYTGLSTQDILDIKLCIGARIYHIEDTLLPMFNRIENDELNEMYKAELEKLYELYNKLKVII